MQTLTDQNGRSVLFNRFLTKLRELEPELALTIEPQGEHYAPDGAKATLSFQIASASRPINKVDAGHGAPQVLPIVAAPSAIQVGQTFQSRGMAYQITNITPRRPKLPIAAKRLHDGRAVRFATSTVAKALSGL